MQLQGLNKIECTKSYFVVDQLRMWEGLAGADFTASRKSPAEMKKGNQKFS
jgi:hypothetical protein